MSSGCGCLILVNLFLQVFERTNSSQAQYTTNSARQPRVTFGTQTDFRESETQTLPTSLTSSPVKGELGALSMLKYGRGLPVQTQEDLVFVDKLRENYEKERNLPPKGENIIIMVFLSILQILIIFLIDLSNFTTYVDQC